LLLLQFEKNNYIILIRLYKHLQLSYTHWLKS